MKNAKILYLDLRCPIGHINFNNIYLNAFLSKGVELDIVLPRTYMSKLSLMKTGYKYYEVPSSLESNNRSSLKNRLAILKYQNFLRVHFDLNSYDLIFVSSFDNIAAVFSFFPRHTLFVCHNNLSFAYSNYLHRFALKLIGAKYKFAVFNKSMFDFMDCLRVKNVFTIFHGFPLPYSSSKTKKDFDYIFLPSSYSLDMSIVSEILTEDFNDFLINTGKKLILKSDLKSNLSNIDIIASYIETEEYQKLLVNCWAVLIPYDSSFRYRTSGVLMEAIANKKIVLIRDIPSFDEFKNIAVKGLFYFKSVEELKRIIKEEDFSFTPEYDFLLINSAENSIAEILKK